jgi:hypothetical protein
VLFAPSSVIVTGSPLKSIVGDFRSTILPSTNTAITAIGGLFE